MVLRGGARLPEGTLGLSGGHAVGGRRPFPLRGGEFPLSAPFAVYLLAYIMVVTSSSPESLSFVLLSPTTKSFMKRKENRQLSSPNE